MLIVKSNRTLRRRLIKKIYFVFRAKMLAMLIQMCYTIVTVRETEPNRAAAVKRTKGKTMENFDYIEAENIIDRMIGSWEEQGSYYGKLPLNNRINADNHYTMLRKKLVSIAETYGIDFLTDLEVRIRTVNEERAK